jgi:cytochrome b561
MAGSAPSGQQATYSTGARHFHWWTVGLLAIQIPVGLYMVYRGNVTNFDALTNTLYSGHKTLGLLILLLVLARLYYRLTRGAPADELTIEWWQKAASHVTHWSLYLLLILVPIVGWIGISLYGAREVFGLFSIPPLAAPDQAAAERMLTLHRYLAFVTIAAIGAHVGGALFHYFIRKDGVLMRMLPQAGKRQ